jgi:hypothetical protein
MVPQRIELRIPHAPIEISAVNQNDWCALTSSFPEDRPTVNGDAPAIRRDSRSRLRITRRRSTAGDEQRDHENGTTRTNSARTIQRVHRPWDVSPNARVLLQRSHETARAARPPQSAVRSNAR